MGKYLDKIGKLEDFKAPWEAETGSAEINPDAVKRLVFNARSGEAKAKDSLDEIREKVTTLETDLAAAKAEVEKASPEEANRKIERLEAALAVAKKENGELIAARDLADLRAEVLDGLEARYAKYVTGDTREDLEKSLEEVRKDFNLGDEDGDEEEDEREAIRSRPRNLRNPADPDGDKKGDLDIDFDAETNDMLGI